MKKNKKVVKRKSKMACNAGVRRSLPLTNQKLWEMAKLITDRQRKTKELSTDKVDWDMLEEDWFDWLEEELFGNDA